MRFSARALILLTVLLTASVNAAPPACPPQLNFSLMDKGLPAQSDKYGPQTKPGHSDLTQVER